MAASGTPGGPSGQRKEPCEGGEPSVVNLRFGNLRKVSRRTPATRVDAYRALCHGLGVGQQGWAQGPMLQMGAESRLRRAAGAEAQDPIQVKCHEFTGQRHADVAYLPPRVDRPATGLR